MMKACPFCGETEKLWIISVNEFKAQYNVYCGSCHAGGPIAVDESTAVLLWDKRFTAPEVQSEDVASKSVQRRLEIQKCQ